MTIALIGLIVLAVIAVVASMFQDDTAAICAILVGIFLLLLGILIKLAF